MRVMSEKAADGTFATFQKGLAGAKKMYSLKNLLNLGVARKLVNWATAIGLVGFIVVHLLGNLAILAPDKGAAFNAYSATLHSLGIGLYILEIGLLLLFVFHIVTGISMWLKNRKAREQKYAAGQTSKKGPSHYNLSSTKMAISGLVLAVFVIIHVAQFRFAAFTDDVNQYAVDATGKNYDLYGLVVDAFANPWWVAFYCFSVFFLGWHLRHGLWSMLHSVGSMNRGGGKTAYAIAAFIGGVLALAFFFLPLYVYIVVH
jgi:succinate dehydrogenase / fumarate reductase cytochrome b subunit